MAVKIFAVFKNSLMLRVFGAFNLLTIVKNKCLIQIITISPNLVQGEIRLGIFGTLTLMT